VRVGFLFTDRQGNEQTGFFLIVLVIGVAPVSFIVFFLQRGDSADEKKDKSYE
jgi:hypothetical protein